MSVALFIIRYRFKQGRNMAYICIHTDSHTCSSNVRAESFGSKPRLMNM